MSDNNGAFAANERSPSNLAWTTGPKEFIYKYIRYLPWVVISVFLFGLLAYVKIRYTTQIFRVQSSMLIKNDNMQMGGGKNERFSDLLLAQDNINLDNEIQILRSRPVLYRVARNLNLQYFYENMGKVRSRRIYPGVPFRLRILNMADSAHGFMCKLTFQSANKFFLNDGKTPYSFGQIIDYNGNKFFIDSIANGSLGFFASPEFQVGWQPLSDVVEGLIGALRITQANDRSTVLVLSYEGENTELGKDVLNGVMNVYDSLVIEDKNHIAYNTLRFIDDRLGELSDTLKGMQGGLNDFMVQSNAFDLEAQSKTYMDKIGDISKKQDEQEIRINVVDWLLQYIGNKNMNFNLVPTNLGIEEPGLVQLITEYNKIQLERENNLKTTTPDNPLIRGYEVALEKLRKDIQQTLLNVRQAYVIAGEGIQKSTTQLQGQVRSLPGKSIRMLNIQRQQKIFEELYSLLLQKKIETSISSASTISNSQIIEPALASYAPISPNTQKIYMFYIIVGILIPVVIVVIREVLQDKVMGKPDIEKQLSTPILGEVGHSGDNKTLVVSRNSRKFIAEQFRILRTNLQYVTGRVENPVIMVTSSFSGEGKSFISTNIGAVMALTGKKTVIIEFDIRKPKIVSGLDLKRKMGITNYIIGKASFDELPVKVEGIDDLYVIPCGPIPPNPAELLLDERLEKFMREVREKFEIVIMDTAPVGLVSDAVTLAKYADCTLYIVRQGYTFRKQLAFIGDLYANKKLPNLSLVLNDAKAEGGYYKGYYGGYGYYAGYGYGDASGYFEDERDQSKSSIGSQIRSWFKKGKKK